MVAPIVWAAIAGTSGMWYWASTNVYQSVKIGEQRTKQLLLDLKELEYKKDLLSQQEYEQRFREYQSELDEIYRWQEHAQDERRLSWDIEKYGLETQADELDYQRDLAKMAQIEAYDETDRQFRHSMQLSSQRHDVGMYDAKAQQLEADRQEYLLDQAFITQQSIDDTFGEPEPMPQVAFILSELIGIRKGGERPLEHDFLADFGIITEEEDDLSIPSNALS